MAAEPPTAAAARTGGAAPPSFLAEAADPRLQPAPGRGQAGPQEQRRQQQQEPQPHKKKAQSKAQAAAEREQLGLVHVEADETDELTKLRNKARRSAATAKETSIDSLTTIDRQLEQTRNDNKKLYSIQVNTCRCEYMLLPGIIPVTHRSDSTCSPR